MTSDDDTRTARMIARGKTRKAGDRSAKLAAQLMKLPAAAAKRLKLDEDLREAVDRARAVQSHIARRRAERTLAGELRRFDLLELADQVAKVNETDSADVQLLHDAEDWRTRMITEGIDSLAGFPTGTEDEEWPRMIAAARRERDTGKPPGAARALFRKIAGVLRDERDAASGEQDDPDDPDADPDQDADLQDTESDS